MSSSKKTTLNDDPLWSKGRVLKIEAKMPFFEQGLKVIELNLSHNTGVLKSRLPDAPLEELSK